MSWYYSGGICLQKLVESIRWVYIVQELKKWNIKRHFQPRHVMTLISKTSFHGYSDFRDSGSYLFLSHDVIWLKNAKIQSPNEGLWINANVIHYLLIAITSESLSLCVLTCLYTDVMMALTNNPQILKLLLHYCILFQAEAMLMMFPNHLLNSSVK